MSDALSTQFVGWMSSLVLLATISRQVWQQWTSGRTDGVSPWLFIGQIAASLGFTLYSALIGNHVFIVTNALLAASAVIGLAVLVVRRPRGAR